MAPQEKASRVELGPTGIAFAENMKRLRVAQGLSLRELADVLKENRHVIAHSGLSKIENKTRRVDVDDLMAIAVALGVPPLALLLPIARSPYDNVELSGWGSEIVLNAWKWATTGSPLIADKEQSTLEEAFPWWLRIDAHYVLEGLNPTSEGSEIAMRSAFDGSALDIALGVIAVPKEEDDGEHQEAP